MMRSFSNFLLRTTPPIAVILCLIMESTSAFEVEMLEVKLKIFAEQDVDASVQTLSLNSCLISVTPHSYLVL